jgi:hypothetical protein
MPDGQRGITPVDHTACAKGLFTAFPADSPQIFRYIFITV